MYVSLLPCARMLLCLDPRFADHLAPLLEFPGEERLRVLGRSRRRLPAQPRKALADIRSVHRLYRLGVQAIDHRARRAEPHDGSESVSRCTLSGRARAEFGNAAL